MPNIAIRQPVSRKPAEPVMARLGLQTLDLLQASSLGDTEKQRIIDVCTKQLPNLLGSCCDINDRMQREVRRCLSEYTTSKDECVQIPQIQDIEVDTETFFTTAHSFLITLSRDVLQIFHPSLRAVTKKIKGKPDKNDNIFILTNDGTSKIVKWAQSDFGESASITKMLEADEEWISELCKIRHAFVHPGGFSGTMKLRNIDIDRDGNLYPPTMTRVPSESSDTPRNKEVGELVLHQQLDRVKTHLLEYAEELIVFGCIAKTIKSSSLTFSEIPESNRNKECPVRFSLAINSE